ncbi:MAG: haloacid dehalogenase-like hydrolase [Myxococcales bacterium]|nr:haloacid dehalogenase-like hydrolase [Myxococcales bacterium]
MSKVLHHILDRVVSNRGASRPAVLIFDLDHTLFDNGPRTAEILTEFAESVDDLELRGRLVGMRRHNLPYLLREILAEVGEVRDELVHAATKFWFHRFFTDAYQRFDEPLPGACLFVNDCFSAGATIVYLTGRDVPKMLLGTTESLRRHGFPVGLARTHLVLKPDFETPDYDFKRDVLEHMVTLGEVVGCFENEPGNCNLFQSRFPGAATVLLETTFAPNPPPLDPGIVRIPDFRR